MCFDNAAAALSLEALVRGTIAPSAAPAGCGAVVAARAQGSRRRRLWELDAHAHCPIVGVCLPLETLRRLASRVLGGEPMADDYELHCGVVTDCRLRTTMAQAVQRELDRRYALALRQAAQAKNTPALVAWWEEALHRQDVAGALWATLTHPRCTPALEHRALGQVHMLQHQAGMARRADLDRLAALSHENAVLSRALAAAQQRSTQLTDQHARQMEAQQRQLMQLRAELIASHTVIAQLRHGLRALEEAVPALKERQALTQENERLTRRLAQMAVALQQHAGKRGQAERRTQPQHDDGEDNHLAGPDDDTLCLQARLDNHTVLCVGGRPAAVPLYRHIVEGTGGRFLHHDGGGSDSSARLDATLSAADLVICQTGCISHNAYWRVKDHCKRTGKRCVFVEGPSTARLKRALAMLTPAPGPAALQVPGEPASRQGAEASP